MSTICLRCQWKALYGPSRQFSRGVVVRQHQTTFHFDRYEPIVQPAPANGANHNRIVWRRKRLREQPMSEKEMNVLRHRKYANLKEKGKTIAAYSARGKNPDRAHPLHYLRAMLRECTYFPDEHVKREMTAYIVDRFRRKSGPDPFDGTEKEAHKMIIQLIARARRGLTYLQRANMGRVDEYTRTLLMAYGRMGKRRHALLSKVREEDKQDNPTYNYVDQVVKEKGIQVHEETQLPVIGPKLEALLKSQAHRAVANDFRHDLSKALTVKVPEKNTWGDPIPKNRQKNIVMKWYQKLLQATLPPLPEAEYTRLEALARGADRSIHAKARRIPARDLTEATGGRLDTLHTIPPNGGTGTRKRKSRGIHKILPYRFLRRRLQLIFQLSPKMTKGDDGKWRVTWGDVLYSKTPLPNEPGRIVERDEIDPKDDPRELKPIKEAAKDIEEDYPEGDASDEIREFLKFFNYKAMYAPRIPGPKSENIALPSHFSRKVDRLISKRLEEPHPPRDS